MAVSLDFSTLPTEFLTEEEISSLMLHKQNHFEPPSFNISTHFPYEFDSFGSNCALNSPGSESGSGDEDDFLAGLTCRLAHQHGPHKSKERVLAASPESTLSGIGSWSMLSNSSPNGVLSPSTTPFGAKNDTSDLMYAADSEVVRLNLSNEMKNCSSNDQDGCLQSRGVLDTNSGPTRKRDVGAFEFPKTSSGVYSVWSSSHGYPQLNQVLKQPDGAVWRRQQVVTAEQQALQLWQRQLQMYGKSIIWSDNERFVTPAGLPPAVWSPLQLQANQCQRLQVLLSQHKQQLLHHHRQLVNCGLRAPAFGGPVKRERTGTGVFLPRRYSNPPEFKKKSTCSTVLLPEKVQALNSNFKKLNVNCCPQPRFRSGAFASDYDAVMRKINAVYAHQRSSHSDSGLSYEINLPQEWTY